MPVDVLLPAVAAVVSGVLTFGVLWESLRSFLRRRLAAKYEAPETLDDKILRLRSATTSLRELAGEVMAEAEAQAAAAEVAGAEAKRNQQLATLSAEQARAVSEIFDASGAKQQKALTKSTIVWAIISLVVSNAVAVGVTLWLAGLQQTA